MKLRLLLSACLLIGAVAIPANAQDKTDATATKDAAKTLEAVKKDQNDSAKLNKYFSTEFSAIFQLVQSGKAAKAEQALATLETVIKGLSPDDAKSKQLVGRAKTTIPFFRSQIELARTSAEDLRKKLDANPADIKSLSLLVKKASMELGSLASSKPKVVKEKLTELKTYIAALADKVDDASKKKTILSQTRSLAGIERSIASSLKLAELVGKPAMDLNVKAWVNGSPLTAADMKGKVVLLDFWAVWCGPCIATFPHLREWQEKYGEKDFVMVGLTRYYKYKWNDATGRASKGDATPEEEHAMLEKFAEHHKIHHRFAVQTDSKASSYYGVSGIPHVVVIDKEGVVRMVKVGSGPANAKAIDGLLKQLLEG